MATSELGKVVVTTAGTPVRATANLSNPAARYICKSYMVQAWPTNSGLAYVGKQSMVKATGVAVTAVLPAPSAATVPAFSASHEDAPAAFDMARIWIDAAVNGEAVLITVVR